MSSKNNVNPDHYKTAGRERQGEDVVHSVQKQRLAETESRMKAEERAPHFNRQPSASGQTRDAQNRMTSEETAVDGQRMKREKSMGMEREESMRMKSEEPMKDSER